MLAQEQQIRSSWSLYEMAGRSLTKSPRDEPYVQLRRLFVSAILSLISILISPVLSTDALWNVISANTANNADTTMVDVTVFPEYASLTTGSAYIYMVWFQRQSLPAADSFYLFSGKSKPILK